MSNPAPVEAIDTAFLSRIDTDGRLKLTACLQCGRCSSGCTMRKDTDILPHRINRMALLGMSDRLLASKAIWACASCHTCVSRCPMGVNTPALIDRLRAMAAQAPEEMERVRVFNETMLGSMRRFGRVYELGMMSVYKLRTRDLARDLTKFPRMLAKGKMRLVPSFAGGRSAVAAMIDRVRRERKAAR